MKLKWILLICMVFLFQFVSSLANPSAAYCEKLGYHYLNERTETGERGYCNVEDNKFEAWAFYQGRVGLEYSYCSKIGLTPEVITNNSLSFQQIYCVNESEITSQYEMMNLIEDIKEDLIFPEYENESESNLTEEENLYSSHLTGRIILNKESSNSINYFGIFLGIIFIFGLYVFWIKNGVKK